MTVETLQVPSTAEISPALRDGFEVHQAALRRGMNVFLLPRQVLMARLGDSTELSFVHGVPSQSTLSAVTFAQDKRMRRARLMENGIPVPKGGTFSIVRGVNDAKRLIRRMGYPVVVKPAVGDNMIEVYAGLHDWRSVSRSVDYLRTHMDERPTHVKAAYALTLLGDPTTVDGRVTVPTSYRFLVEKQVPGEYIRLLVINDQVVSAMHCPKHPQFLEEAHDVTDELHPSLTLLAREAVRAMHGMALAAVDIVVPDYRHDVATHDAWVVELSERPWLSTQAVSSESLSREIGDRILQAHAADFELELPEPHHTLAVRVHLEGAASPAAGPTLGEIAARYGLSADLQVTDPIAGGVDGTLAGDPAAVALFCELLLDEGIDGHNAMAIESIVLDR